MPNIDHMRFKAVQELEKLGWKFVDNKWEAPNKLNNTIDEVTSNYVIALHEHYKFHKNLKSRIKEINLDTLLDNIKHIFSKYGFIVNDP